MSYIEKGKKSSAELICGGNRIEREGFFVEPTIFGNCTEDMEIVRDEIFGPVISVLKFNDIDEAIELANNTKYGLVGAVFSED